MATLEIIGTIIVEGNPAFIKYILQNPRTAFADFGTNPKMQIKIKEKNPIPVDAGIVVRCSKLPDGIQLTPIVGTGQVVVGKPIELPAVVPLETIIDAVSDSP